MLRFVPRFLLVILTLALLVMAVMQVTGRIVFSLLDEAQPAANRLLAQRGVEFAGLAGDWRLLNPVLRVDRIGLTSGEVRGLLLEIDLLRSLWAGEFVARRLQVAAADLRLEHDGERGWHLAGSEGGGDYDPLPLLRDSEQLALHGRIHFAAVDGTVSTLRVDYVGTNRGGVNRHRLDLTEAAACPGPCGIRVDLQHQEGLRGFREERSQLAVRVADFGVPPPLTGPVSIRVPALDFAWQRSGADSGGALSVAAEIGFGSDDAVLHTRAGMRVHGQRDQHRGRLGDWEVRHGDARLALPEVALFADRDGATALLDAVDLGPLAEFAAVALADVDPAGRWLDALALRGHAERVDVRLHRARAGSGAPGVDYRMDLHGLAIDGYQGVPDIVNVAGELTGSGRFMQLDVHPTATGLAFPELFHEGWELAASGRLQAWISRDFTALRGIGLHAEVFGSRVAGGFALTRGPTEFERRVALVLEADRIAVADARGFVPYRLPPALLSWLETGPAEGTLIRPRFALEGQFRAPAQSFARRIELAADVEDGVVRYHPDWPLITGLSGTFAVAGSEVRVAVRNARSHGATLDGSAVRLRDNAATVEIALAAALDAEAALAFVRESPLQEWLPIIAEDWNGAGALTLSGPILIPLRRDATDAELALELQARLDGVAVGLPEYRLELHDLAGTVSYRYPYDFAAADVQGRLFDDPVRIGVTSGADGVAVSFSGSASPASVWQLLGVADPGIAAGVADYQADLDIPVQPQQRGRLRVRTDLAGLALDLPAGYGKDADTSEPLEVDLAFLPDYQALRLSYRHADAWLHLSGGPLRGALALDASLPVQDIDLTELLVVGQIERFALAELAAAGAAAAGTEGSGLSLPIRLRGVAVDRIDLGRFALTNALLDGTIAPQAFELSLASDNANGHISRNGAEPIVVELAELHLPAASDSENDSEKDPQNDSQANLPTDPERTGPDSDPLSPDLIANAPAARVRIDRLRLGADDFGSWSFELEPRDGELAIHTIEAQVRGVEIRSLEGMVWNAERNDTTFIGELHGGDLSEVLPLWGYAPSVETRSASLRADLRWAGSPAAVGLVALAGEVDARARSGRFLEVEGGGNTQRMFSLLNFTTVAKRMSLDFSDVFGRGVSFDELNARFRLDRGLLQFEEPMTVSGTGSSFRVTGTVDLRTRRLDNEMIVTLPVSSSLPWYAAYVALANPLAGLGVLVGGQMLRKPLDQFSSARYRISGTVEDPVVRFVSVFDLAPQEPQAVADPTNGPMEQQDDRTDE